jgi:tetraacyldisaccharide 4'-kinase
MTPHGLPRNGPVAALLSAPALLYRSAVALRNGLYDAGVMRVRRLPCPVVSIGNLTVGGTGKTPITSFVAGMLRDAGYRVGVVSRGYRRRGGRAALLVSDGRSILAEPFQAGDEPCLIARDNPAVAVAVGADRVAAARLLIDRTSPEVILLDDAFQHRRIFRDVNLLLVDGREPWGNGRMLPAGPLREPISGVARADALVITRPEGRFPQTVAPLLARHNPGLAVFHARIEPRVFVRPDGETVSCASLRGFSAFAFSGIARPERFEDDLRSLGLRLPGFRRFRDHHPYALRDLEAVAREARAAGADILVTTEKDLVRISAWPARALPAYALAQRVVFGEGSDLPAWLLDRLQALRSPAALRAAPSA